MSLSVSAIHGHLLEVTVVGCNKLRDTEWISRQDPYVCLEYASAKHRTRTCTDGGKTPTFQDKFVFSLIEGFRELNVTVWNSNVMTDDDFIGSGKVQLYKVLSQGYDDSNWALQTKSGRAAGQVRVIMHFENGMKLGKVSAPFAPQYQQPVPQASLYSAPPPPGSYPPVSSYPPSAPYFSYPQTSAYSPYPYAPSHQQAAYPPPPSAYHPPQQAAYPPPPSAYPPPQQAAYPSAYPPPPSIYPPPPSTYPPPPQSSPYYPSGPYPGHYPAPPPSY